MKKLLFIIAIGVIGLGAKAQTIKVSTAGNVGIL